MVSFSLEKVPEVISDVEVSLNIRPLFYVENEIKSLIITSNSVLISRSRLTRAGNYTSNGTNRTSQEIDKTKQALLVKIKTGSSGFQPRPKRQAPVETKEENAAVGVAEEK